MYSLVFRVIWAHIRFFLFFDNFFMKKILFSPQRKSAFSLIELLVVIGIIAILALWASKLNFSRLSLKQKVSIESIHMVSLFEEVRNNALLGKAVGTNNVIPLSWKIAVSRTGSGTIQSLYTETGSNWITYSTLWWNARFPFEIFQVQCTRLDGTNTQNLSGTWEFIFTGSTLSFSGGNCQNQNQKLIEITQGTPDIQEKIRINTVTWVIEQI